MGRFLKGRPIKPVRKSPFVGYTVEEVVSSEAVLFMVQVGKNVLEIDGQYFFLRKAAVTHYNRILKDLIIRIYNGDDKAQKQAKSVLPYLRIVPLRLH